MSFGVIQYKSPFRCVPRHPDHICAFCGTKVDVKYAYDVESATDYPEASRCDETSVYSCSSCTLKRMYTPPKELLNGHYEYDFDITDPYQYMSTLQRMYKDLETARDRFHKQWIYCYGCHKYIRMDSTIELTEPHQWKCSVCSTVVKE